MLEQQLICSLLPQIDGFFDGPFQELNTDPDFPSVDENVTVIGFGYAGDGNEFPDTLQEAEVKVVSDSVCDAQHVLGVVDEYHLICAGLTGTGGKDSCAGDSGGPLFAPGSQAWGIQVGLTATETGSMGPTKSCGDPNESGIYVRLSAHQVRIL
jgi:secreted trypsin-like serine protease